MFIRHGAYVINTDPINFMKIRDNGTSIALFFEGKPDKGGSGYNLNIRFEDEDAVAEFLELLNSRK